MNTDIFDNNIDRLENIFGKTLISQQQERLKEIFESTERTWFENLNRLENQKVENILIAEAAPWSESGITPRYFYNNIESKYHLNIWRVFFPYTSVPTDREQSYKMLAEKGFLLVRKIKNVEKEFFCPSGEIKRWETIFFYAFGKMVFLKNCAALKVDNLTTFNLSDLNGTLSM